MNGHSFIFCYINGKLYFKVAEYAKILMAGCKNKRSIIE